MYVNIEGKVAIITGASRGIGKGIAEKLASEGAQVVLVDIDSEQLAITKQAIEEKYGPASSFTLDVSQTEQVRNLFKEIHEKYNSIDIVINNAGVTRDAMLHKMTDEQFQEVLDVHMKGTFLFMREASTYMKAQKSGAIVNISSIAGKVGNIGQVNYSGAKAGIIGMTKAAAKELARHNVRVNAILPGLIETDMTRKIPENVRNQMIQEVPLQRPGYPEDIANAVLYLSSELSSYVTGTTIEVAGGFYI